MKKRISNEDQIENFIMGLNTAAYNENCFNNVEGSYKYDSYDSAQMGYWHPNDGWPNHRTPINNY